MTSTHDQRLARLIESARESGADDAYTACRESLSTGTPDGGWDGWLINAGLKIAARALGLTSLDGRDGDRLPIAEELLGAYAASAEAAAEEFAESAELAELIAERDGRDDAEQESIAAENEAAREELAAEYVS